MTEIIWEGKYNKEGKKNNPIKIALPFQTIETINESASDRQKRLSSLFQNRTENQNWYNRLIWGDKKYVLPSLLPEFAGKVNLIYIDPPFDTGADFSFTSTIPNHPENEDEETTSFLKQPSIIEQKAYRDTWGVSAEEKKRGATHLDKYLKWFYDTVVLLRELLAEEGSIYVHLDWHVGHYAKCVLDEVFGYENFKNEIIWQRNTSHNDGNKFGCVHDNIFYFGKNIEKSIYNRIDLARTEEEIKKRFPLYDEKSKLRYVLDNLAAAGQGPVRKFDNKIIPPPPGNHWRYSQENIDKLISQGRIVISSNGVPRYKRYENDTEGKPVQDVWFDFFAVASQSKELLNYNTQKPEQLLERIIKASSNENDLVLDCFCGSGTTSAVAEKLNRRWIACDLGRYAIHTTRKRMLSIPNVKPFIVQNLGKYERQQWMQMEFENQENRITQEKSYRDFIIELYHAKSISGYAWIHGVKAGRFVHIGNVDAPISDGDIKQIVQEFWRSVGKNSEIKTNGIDILGWDFAFELNETAAQFAAANKVDLKFKKIPREVLEKKAVEQGDIKFFEMASLAVKTKMNKNNVKLTLKNFIIQPDDIPEEVRGKISHWSQWIDYWAVDWNYKNDTFHNEWQSYRTRQNSDIELETHYDYEKKEKYTILVKVIDILGNDTTKAIEISL